VLFIRKLVPLGPTAFNKIEGFPSIVRTLSISPPSPIVIWFGVMLRVISVARVHDTEWLIVSSSAIPPPCNGVCSTVLVPEREHVGLGGGAIPPPFESLYSR
jgi:hypothetical protein